MKKYLDAMVETKQALKATLVFMNALRALPISNSTLLSTNGLSHVCLHRIANERDKKLWYTVYRALRLTIFKKLRLDHNFVGQKKRAPPKDTTRISTLSHVDRDANTKIAYSTRHVTEI